MSKLSESQSSSSPSWCAFPSAVQRRGVAPQNHWHLVKDIPWGETEVFLRVNRRQFKCEHCLKPFSEELNFVRKRQKSTNRYAQLVAEEVINGDLLNVAKRHNLTEDEVESMINQVSQKFLPVDLKHLKRLGIDEITLVKGQGKFIIVLVDLDSRQLIGLVKERKAKSLEKYLSSWGNEILGQIEEVIRSPDLKSGACG